MKVNSQYEVLATEFEGRGKAHSGWFFKQVKRVGDIALYCRSDEHLNTYYEVIVVQFSSGGVVNFGGKEVSLLPKEIYPSNEQFGTMGWCFSSLAAADTKFASLLLQPQ
jgi:hypothetical protein